jgi:hypothetical protein
MMSFPALPGGPELTFPLCAFFIYCVFGFLVIAKGEAVMNYPALRAVLSCPLLCARFHVCCVFGFFVQTKGKPRHTVAACWYVQRDCNEARNEVCSLPIQTGP